MTDKDWVIRAKAVEEAHKAIVQPSQVRRRKLLRIQAFIENLPSTELLVLRLNLGALSDGHNESKAAGVWCSELSQCTIFTVDIDQSAPGSFRRAQAIRRAFELASKRAGEKFSYVTMASHIVGYLTEVNQVYKPSHTDLSPVDNWSGFLDTNEETPS